MISKDFLIKVLIIYVVVVGITLRLVLAWVNSDANDDHLPVITTIVEENRIPELKEHWQSYHPKFYHLTSAMVWKVLPSDSFVTRVRSAQFVSALAGIGTVAAIYYLLTIAGSNYYGKLIAIAFVSLNPRLISINAQATNDSFVILFTSLALVFGYLFFERWKVKYFLPMTATVVLAGLTKGNGLVIFIAAAIVFVAALFRQNINFDRKKVVLYLLLFIILYGFSILIFGPYWDSYFEFGTPFAINWPRAPFPNLFEKTYIYRPGITSIVDSYFTFRFVDLLKNPISTWVWTDEYPLHRTSLWSQLFGRTYFAHYNNWPPMWQYRSPGLINMGRLIFLAALLPTIIFSGAILRRISSPIKYIRKKYLEPFELSHIFFDLTIAGFFSLLIWHSLRYRDYASIKVIYVFPALAAFLLFFSHELDRFYAKLTKYRLLTIAAHSLFVVLFVLSISEIMILIGQLWECGFVWKAICSSYERNITFFN